MSESAAALIDHHPKVDELRLTERHALADLHAVLRLCDSGRLRCSDKTRRPAAASVVMIADTLSGGDFYPDEAIAAYAWPLLVQTGGLAEIVGGRLQLTARGRSALGKPAAEVIRGLWRSWITKAVLDELSRVEHIKGQRATNVLTSAKTRRQRVSAALATCRPGAWVELDDLFASMREAGLSPTVARSDRALWKLYLVDAQYGSLGYAGFGEWEILEGRYTLAVIFEYAATLGLVDVAYDEPDGARDDYHGNWGADHLDYLSRYDGLRAVRLNGLGAYALDLTASYRPPADAAPIRNLKVLSNLDLVATGELSPADRLVLDAYAKRTAERVWALTADTVLAAVAAGHTADQLRDFLGGRMEQPGLPATLLVLLDDVTARAGRLRDLGQVRLTNAPIRH
ncbi:helicase-associated domain-containing protein [Actinopolymorpha pittospori]|uniref:Helicase XPB/Ssl2 N-terminal domain-containing protein n=1 Tax=Actinopolymorpha pittospori TaxID=648752 RepID=A0A927MT38_9ACTN|nr:helicase-associated domain-containing protein [Actinopolymorpha pittospori]MBE1604748.1 hypothetical protein [Actinopolymorpha pittospori]